MTAYSTTIRIILRPPTTTSVVLKTALTDVSVAASAAAFRFGAKLSESPHHADDETGAGQKARLLAARMKWRQWTTPTTTAALLALGEKQRGVAGLLDCSSSVVHRS